MSDTNGGVASAPVPESSRALSHARTAHFTDYYEGCTNKVGVVVDTIFIKCEQYILYRCAGQPQITWETRADFVLLTKIQSVAVLIQAEMEATMRGTHHARLN